MDEVESKARSELGLKLSMSERRAAQLETENHQLKVKLNQKEVELEKTQSARDVNNRKGKPGLSLPYPNLTHIFSSFITFDSA